MEIQINVLNEMKKLRTSTYADKFTWVDELVQNAQRANATNIHVTTDYLNDTIIVEDNGCGCTDPQVLFRKSDTGWDETVVKNESPFGEGFFSTMMAANKIEVESVGFNATFDVNKMFDTGNIDCIEITPNNRKSGFKVTLSELTDDCSLIRTESRFKDVCRYIKKPATYINGDKIPYEGLNPQDKSKYLVKMDNDIFSGWLTPHSWRHGNWSDNYLKAFAYDRYVRDLQHHDLVNGIINLKPGAVILRSPDRHDIIQDEKYDNLIALIEDGIKSVMAKILKYGDDKIIKDFEGSITRYLTPEECKKYIKFKFIDDRAKPDDFTDGTDTPDDDDSMSVYDDTPDSTLSGPTMSYVDDAPPQIADDAFMEPIVKTKTPRNTPKSEQTGQTLDGVKYAFYIKESDIERLKSSIEIAQSNKIPIIVIRNDIELRCIESTMNNIKPLEDMENYVSIVGSFKNATPKDAFEQRIYNLLNGISSRLLNVPDLFIIADTSMHKVLAIENSTFEINEIENVATAYNGKIYVNRKYIKTYGVALDNNQPFLNDMDKRFILLNIETIANELASIMYHTTISSREHYMRMIEIIQKIVYMLYD